MPARDAVTGLVLAGGRSRRFGSDKALAEIDGTPLVARVAAALAPHCAEVLVATGAAPRVYPVDARVVVDAEPDSGPLGGLVAGLRETRTPWLLVAACDFPYLTPDALAPLLEIEAGDADAVVALDGEGRFQPVCARYHTRIEPIAAAHLAARRLALHALLDRLAVRTVGLDAGALRNVNAPSDLAR